MARKRGVEIVGNERLISLFIEPEKYIELNTTHRKSLFNTHWFQNSLRTISVSDPKLLDLGLENFYLTSSYYKSLREKIVHHLTISVLSMILRP